MSDHVNGEGERPRIRVPAGNSAARLGSMTTDSLSNFVARLGVSQPNLLAGSTYGFNPISRLQQLLEWAYRGSWIVGAACDVIADDMTRAGVQFNSDTDPEDIEELHTSMNEMMLWQKLNETIKWSRLYGGALMVMLIDGQNPATPLDPETVGPGQLKGFLVLDRWMVQTVFEDLVYDFGPDYGMPRFYDMVATAPFLPRMRVHYSRVVRIDGVMLPFRQQLAENGWGMSVVERLYDRLLAFDSGTMGVSQLLFKAYLRTYKVNGYRTLIGAGGELTERFVRSMDLMRMLQSNEGLTVIDKEDEFDTHTYNFGGLADTLNILGQQISGALGIPLTRLFGQSPTGMDSTGESDIRLYYDTIKAAQEARLRKPLTRVMEVLWQSTLGSEPPPTFNFSFNSLRQLDETEKSELAERDAATISGLHSAGIISTSIALKELKQSSILTGRFTNITEEDIKASEEAPDPWEQPPPGQGMLPGMAGAPGMPGHGPPGLAGAVGGGGAKPPGAGGAPPPKMPGAAVPAPKGGGDEFGSKDA